MSEVVNKPKMLILDDEAEILSSLKRIFYRTFSVDLFEDPTSALQALKEENYIVIISDMRMPQMDGAAFLSESRTISPESIRILLTGYADMDRTIKAINDGAIFAYVEKPWDNQNLKTIVSNGVDNYNLRHENRQLNIQLTKANNKLEDQNAILDKKVKERTKALIANNEKLKTSNKTQKELFHQLLDLVESLIRETLGDLNGHTKRVATHARLLAQELELTKAETNQIYLAGLMLDIGRITLPKELNSIPFSELTNEQKLLVYESAISGAEIILKIPRLRHVANIVRHQFECHNGEGYPDHLTKDDIPLGAKIIKIVSEYDGLILGKLFKNKVSADEAKFYLKENRAKRFDRKITDVYLDLLKRLPDSEELNTDFCVSIKQLEPGMILAHDVLNKAGGIMLTKDSELTATGIEKLKQYEEQMAYHLSIYIY